MNTILQRAIELLEAASNIYNVDELTQKLSHMSNQGGTPSVKKWINSNLKKYVLSTTELHTKVTRLPTNAPEWAKDALENNNLDYINFDGYTWRDFEQGLEHAILYLNTLVDRDISRISVPDALLSGEEYITRQEKLEDTNEKPGDSEVIYAHKDGYYWVKLITQNAFKLESHYMQHCVGKDSQYYTNSKAGLIEIWSLRDKQNKPHCTVEYRIRERAIKQVKGKQNKGVIKKYQHYVIEFLTNLQHHGVIRNFNKDDLINISILDVDGVWYDLNELPDDNIDILIYMLSGDFMMHIGRRVKKDIYTGLIKWFDGNKKKIHNVLLASSKSTAEHVYNYAYYILNDEFPEGEDKIAEDAFYAYNYAHFVLNGPFPEGEDAIAKDARSSYMYATYVLKGERFVKGEDAIAKDAEYSYAYADDILKGERFVKGEDAIAKDAGYSYSYADDILKGERFVKGEDAIAKDAEYSYLYARYILKGERFIKGEESIAKDAEYSYLYAKHALKGERFIEGEESIAEDAEYSYLYARYILKGERFIKGENAILSDEIYADMYNEMVGLR